MGRCVRVVGPGHRKYTVLGDMGVTHQRASPGMEKTKAQVFGESRLVVGGRAQ